jgi:hypothetical protein
MTDVANAKAAAAEPEVSVKDEPKTKAEAQGTRYGFFV